MNEEERQTWLHMELWALREAAYLLCDREPEDEDALMSEMHTTSNVAHAYRALKDATLTKSLTYTRVDSHDTLMRRRVSPSDAVAWATKRGLAVPDAFKDVAPAAEKPAARRARRLARFRALGGDMRPAGDTWQSIGTRGALAALVKEEAGKPASKRQDVSRDLRAAMAVQLQG